MNIHVHVIALSCIFLVFQCDYCSVFINCFWLSVGLWSNKTNKKHTSLQIDTDVPSLVILRTVTAKQQPNQSEEEKIRLQSPTRTNYLLTFIPSVSSRVQFERNMAFPLGSSPSVLFHLPIYCCLSFFGLVLLGEMI